MTLQYASGSEHHQVRMRFFWPFHGDLLDKIEQKGILRCTNQNTRGAGGTPALQSCKSSSCKCRKLQCRRPARQKVDSLHRSIPISNEQIISDPLPPLKDQLIELFSLTAGGTPALEFLHLQEDDLQDCSAGVSPAPRVFWLVHLNIPFFSILSSKSP